MNYIWGTLFVIIGLFMFISAIRKSNFIVYKLLHVRAKMLWGDHAHNFLMIVGIIITGLSTMFFLGLWG